MWVGLGSLVSYEAANTHVPSIDLMGTQIYILTVCALGMSNAFDIKAF